MKKNSWTALSLLILTFFSLVSFAHTTPQQPLSVNQAFRFTATAKDYQTAILQWQIAPGYYLYRDRFKIRALKPEAMRLAQPILPFNSIEKSFPPLGQFAVYNKNIYIIQPIINSNKESITLQVSYQGCSKNGYCYPPTSKVVTINLSNHYMLPVKGVAMDVALPTVTANPQHKIITILSTKNWWHIIVGFFIFGVLISFTPCVLPMIPILSSIIVGQGNLSHKRSFILSLLYVLGMAVTYAIAGVLFGFIGHSIQADFQQPWLISIFAAIFVAMALSLFGIYNLQLPETWRSKLAMLSNHQKRGTIIGVILMGVFSTLILSPCVTPPLVGVLAYISQSGNATLGGVALFIMGIGMGLPLLLIGAFGPKLIPHTGKWMITIKNFMGVLMLAVAIWMLSRIIPEIAAMLLWSMLIIGYGIALGALSSSRGCWQHLRKTLGLLLFIYGIVLAVATLLGSSNPFNPFSHQSCISQYTQPNFVTVYTVDDIYHQLNLPQHKNKPAIIDFYADWCVACKEMERLTFSNKQVQHALTDFILLKADVTRNDTAAKNLERHFDVVAPPTLLFFNAQHNEVKGTRIIGFTEPQHFLRHLSSIHKSTLNR